ncbi:MAG: aminopeptidase P family protein [Prevotella sp.]|nr:aminopeptidase P family protein [Prevotella sp.]
MHTTSIAQRLDMLREELRRERLAAFIFPTSDPHNSEYTADHWKGREWISGFDGSAGTAVVTLTSAALWTDSRYFIAAEQQLQGTEFQLMKLKIAGTPTIAQWLGRQHLESTEIAIDGSVCAASMVMALKEELRHEGGLTLRTNLDVLSRIWSDRPPIPKNTIEVQPLEFAGESCSSKLARIRKALRERHADGMLMAQLDDIAWTLNLRGSDVHCNPVFVSYLLIASTSATLYINKEKLTPAVAEHLRTEGIATDDYTNIGRGLADYFEYNILIDPDEVNYTLYQAAKGKQLWGEASGATTADGRGVIDGESPVPLLKAVKNEHEIAGFQQAMLRDGIAMVKWLCWLDSQMQKAKHAERAAGNADHALTEIAVSDKLESLRAEQPLYRGLSFDTIAGYEAHGAIVHYEATPQSDATLQPQGLLLVDSGAQYQDGTTDITRTIALGPLSEEQRRVYTLVLKGHIRLQQLHFPDGASGTQLDAIARSPLWQAGLNYLHGTGHGVGSYLSVHEGPHQIRMEWRPAPMHSGMTVTDEPGIYLEGRFGVRIENTLLVVPAEETECGRFLRFETLTLCPIDLRPVIAGMLSSDERQWLNDYHRHVCQQLLPHLDADERRWLQEATKEI